MLYFKLLNICIEYNLVLFSHLNAAKSVKERLMSNGFILPSRTQDLYFHHVEAGETLSGIINSLGITKVCN